MKKIVLRCKPGRSFGMTMGPILCSQGYRVRQDDHDLIEVEPKEKGPLLEDFFDPDYIKALEEKGVIVTVET